MRTPFDFFDGIFCITTSPTSQRHLIARGQFSELNISPETFLSKITTPYQDGCAYAHQECVRIAKERGYKNVLIFEDDVLFINYNSSTFLTALKELPSHWELFFLGGLVLKKKLVQYSSSLIKAAVSEAHAYAVNSTVFDEIISWEIPSGHHITHSYIAHFDSFLINPMMAIQLDPQKPHQTHQALQRFSEQKYIFKKIT